MQVVEVEHNQIQMQESGGTNQQNKEMKMQKKTETSGWKE